MARSFDEAAARLGAVERQEHGSGVSDSDIAVAEKALSLKIRGSYLEFLRRFGWGGASGAQVYGLGKDVPRYLDLVSVTISERVEMHPRLRIDLIPFFNDGAGNHYCLEQVGDGEDPRVVFWDHEQNEGQQPDVVASSFAEWWFEKLGWHLK